MEGLLGWGSFSRSSSAIFTLAFSPAIACLAHSVFGGLARARSSSSSSS